MFCNVANVIKFLTLSYSLFSKTLACKNAVPQRNLMLINGLDQSFMVHKAF